MNSTPSAFQSNPELKFIIKRIQIYDLLYRGLVKEAKLMYIYNFSQVINSKEFKKFNDHFDLIFANLDISLPIINKCFKKLKMEFHLYSVKDHRNLMKQDSILILKKETGFRLSICDLADVCGYSLLSEELKIYRLITNTLKKKEEEKSSYYILDRISNHIQSISEVDPLSIIINNDCKGSDLKLEIYEDILKCEFFESQNNNSDILKTRSHYYNMLLDRPGLNISFEDLYDYYNSSSKHMNFILNENNVVEYFDNKVIDNNILEFFVIGKNCKEYFLKYKNPYYSSSMFNLNNVVLKSEDVNKYYCSRECDLFIKYFTPKFMKKENLDKIIIRKFKKYLKHGYTIIKNNQKKEVKDKIKRKDFSLNNSNFINIGKNCKSMINKVSSSKTSLNICSDTNLCLNPTNKNSNSQVSTITFTDSLVDFSNTNNSENDISDSFAYKFAFNNYFPPFTIQNNNETLSFKSINLSYLFWLFKNSHIQELYSGFSENYSNSIAEKIIKDNDLYSKELNICNKLKFYIKHFNLIYRNLNNEMNNINIVKQYKDYYQNIILDNRIQSKNMNNIKIDIIENKLNSGIEDSSHTNLINTKDNNVNNNNYDNDNIEENSNSDTN